MGFSQAGYLARRAAGSGQVVLDFGCGRGATVRELIRLGRDGYGVDVFFGGMDWQRDNPADLLEAGRVRRIEAGRIPFPDHTFDVVVSDQVLEHVADLAGAVAEMVRVLRPGGVMYHQYPTLEVIREAHFAVPWAHRIGPGARRRYLALAAGLGLGKHRSGYGSPSAWARHSSDWIDRYCVYRPRAEIEAVFHRYQFRAVHEESAYCLARAEGKPLLGRAVRALPGPAAGAFRRLGFDAVAYRPVNSASKCRAPA